MNIRINTGCLEILLIVFHELTTGLLIQRRFGEGNDQQTFYYLQDVQQTPLGRVPVLLQGVHTDVTTWLRDVWVENLRKEIAFWWVGREIILQNDAATEYSTLVWCTDWPMNVSLDISNITLRVLDEGDALHGLL